MILGWWQRSLPLNERPIGSPRRVPGFGARAGGRGAGGCRPCSCFSRSQSRRQGLCSWKHLLPMALPSILRGGILCFFAISMRNYEIDCATLCCAYRIYLRIREVRGKPGEFSPAVKLRLRLFTPVLAHFHSALGAVLSVCSPCYLNL